MFKYNIVPIETSYKIPYSPEYKYKLDIGENLFPVHSSINNVLQSCYDNTNVNYYNNKDDERVSFEEFVKYINTLDKNNINNHFKLQKCVTVQFQ